MTTLDTIGAQLKQLRLSKGLTIDQIAEATEINRGNISQIENGKKNSNLTTLIRIVEACGGEILIK